MCLRLCLYCDVMRRSRINFYLAVGLIHTVTGAAGAQEGGPAGYACTERGCGPSCNPACLPGDICVAGGRCMRLVRLEPEEAVEPELDPEPTTRRNSTALMVTGIATSGLGGIVLGLGMFAWVFAEKDCSGLHDESLRTCEQQEKDQAKYGGRMLVIGALAATAGIPLIVIGASRVPIESAEAHEPARRGSPRAALVLGPSGLTWRGEF